MGFLGEMICVAAVVVPPCVVVGVLLHWWASGVPPWRL